MNGDHNATRDSKRFYWRKQHSKIDVQQIDRIITFDGVPFIRTPETLNSVPEQLVCYWQRHRKIIRDYILKQYAQIYSEFTPPM